MTKTHNYPTIKVGELKERLAIYPDHYDLDFCGLTFNDLEEFDGDSLQMSFAEVVYRTPEGVLVVQDSDL